MAYSKGLSVRNNSSVPSILPSSTSSSTTSTKFLIYLLLLFFRWFYSHQTPRLECTLPDTSGVPSLLSLGINNTLPNPLLVVYPNPYVARAILVGCTGCNCGSLSLANRPYTCSYFSQCCGALTILGSPFSEAAYFLVVPLFWTKASSSSPLKLSFKILTSVPHHGSCFHPPESRCGIQDSKVRCVPFRNFLKLFYVSKK